MVSRLRGLVLGTPYLAKAAAFYTQAWGLTELTPDAGGTRYFGGAGDEPWLLALEPADVPVLSRVRFGVDDTARVDALANRLSAAGVEIVADPATIEGPGGHYGVLFRDPDGRVTEVSAVTAPMAARGGQGPRRVSHVVLNSTDPRRTVAFYVDQLGFRISDWYEQDYLIFLRCGVDHHAIGVGKAAGNTLNHVAYLVDDLEAVMMSGGRVIRSGAQPIWGPGRHGPGGNVFSYFEDPSGFVVEFTADLIQIPEGTDWTPQQWARAPEVGNVWGTGGPSPRAVELMAGAGQASSS